MATQTKNYEKEDFECYTPQQVQEGSKTILRLSDNLNSLNYWLSQKKCNEAIRHFKVRQSAKEVLSDIVEYHSTVPKIFYKDFPDFSEIEDLCLDIVINSN
jgi:hypothetical protein